jgi:glycopeptide antibiotics resistance protein
MTYISIAYLFGTINLCVLFCNFDQTYNGSTLKIRYNDLQFETGVAKGKQSEVLRRRVPSG